MNKITDLTPTSPVTGERPYNDLYIIRKPFLQTIVVKDNLRSGVPYIFCRGGKVRLIQLLEYLSVASPESGLFSDWSRNKKVLRTEP